MKLVKIQNYIAQSNEEKLLNYILSISKALKRIRYFVENTPNIIKNGGVWYYIKNKEKPQYAKKQNTYYLVCKKKTNNKNIRGVLLVNKIATQKSLYTDCSSRKSTFLKPIKSNKKQKFKQKFWEITKTRICIVKSVKNIQATHFQKNSSNFRE